MLYNKGDILFALPQRRNTNGENTDAVIEIPVLKLFAFISAGMSLFVAETKRTSTFTSFVPRTLKKRPVFDHPEKLSLKLRIQFADLIEEKSAVAGNLQ